MFKKLLFTITMLLFGTSLVFGQQQKNFTSMSVDEFEKVIADTNVVRLDVRRIDEFAAGHLVGAVNIDVLKPDFESNAISALDKSKTIAVYCRSGRRSKSAATVLSNAGYRVVELNTGYLGWTAAGKPTAK